MNEEDLRERLALAWQMPYGRGQVAAVEEIIRHADAQGFSELQYAARMLGTTAYVYGGEPAKAFVTFSWCLAVYDRGEADHRFDDRLFWDFKAIVNTLTSFPEVPLERTYAAIDDMERRYRLAGHTMNPVHQYRTLTARHIGDRDTAAEHYRLWCAAPRGDMSDCIGCEPTDKVHYLSWIGRDEDAVALAVPVLSGQMTCYEQPHSILTQLLLPYLRTGRLEEAASAHRQAYRAIQSDRAHLGLVADHIAFCAYSGNTARGLELVTRHHGWLTEAPDPLSDMNFCASSALVLRLIAEAGHGDLTAGESTVDELRVELTRRALDLAESFDVRNGTTEQSDQIQKLLAATPIVDHLPLSGPARQASEPVAAPAPELPATPEELIELAEHEARLRNSTRQIWARFDEVCPDPAPALLAKRLNAKAGDLAQTDPDAAEQAWLRSVELFAEVGDEVHRQVALGRLALLHCYVGKVEDGLAGLLPTVSTLAEIGDAGDHARALNRLAVGYRLADRVDDALATWEQAATIADDPALRAEIALYVAETTGSAEHVERSISLYSGLGPSDGLRLAQAFGAQLALSTGDVDRAVELLDEAALTGDRLVRGQSRHTRGQIAMDRDEIEDAYRALSSAVSDLIAAGRDVHAAHAKIDLAAAALAHDRPTEAADAAEEAIPVLDELEFTDEAARARFLLARAYRELGEQKQAVDLLDLVVAHCAEQENHAGMGQMQAMAASILDKLDHDEAAAIRFTAAADSYAKADAPVDELENRRKAAMSWRWTGNVDHSLAALTAAEETAARLTDADDPGIIWERAILAYDGARILAAANREPDALERVGPAAALFRTAGAGTEAAMADALHGRLLFNQGRVDEAETLLTASLEALPDEAEGPRQDILELLSTFRSENP